MAIAAEEAITKSPHRRVVTLTDRLVVAPIKASRQIIVNRAHTRLLR